jgi:hypothetical protein
MACLTVDGGVSTAIVCGLLLTAHYEEQHYEDDEEQGCFHVGQPAHTVCVAERTGIWCNIGTDSGIY